MTKTQRADMIRSFLTFVPVIFAAGGMYWEVRDMSEEVRESHAEIHNHVTLTAHPVASERLDTLEVDVAELSKEQRNMAANLGAICHATGARCR